MGARGKKAAAALTVVPAGVDHRPEPWPTLSQPEAVYWRNVVDSLPASWLRPSDLPLLAAYCRAAAGKDAADARLATEDAVVDNKPNPNFRIADMYVRQMAQLAGKLRLCPSARYDPQKANTQAKQTPAAKPWEFGKTA